MAPRKTKFVTLQIPAEQLIQFPDLTAHRQEKKPRSKPTKITNENANKIESVEIQPKVKLILNQSEPVSKALPVKAQTPHDSQSPSAATQTPNNAATASNKLSSNIRVGISGLSMNPSIVREIDTSQRRAGKWIKFDKKAVASQAENTQTAAEKAEMEQKQETKTKRSKKVELPDKKMVDTTHGVISMRDFRAYKEHDAKDRQVEIIEYAKSRDFKVVRSFTGYLTLWPSWRRVEEGTLEKKAEFVNEKTASQSKNSKDAKTNKNGPSKPSSGSDTPIAATETAKIPAVSKPEI